MMKYKRQNLIKTASSFFIINKVYHEFRKKFIFLMTMASITQTASAENLVFNSGFELGDAGTGLVRYLRLDTNPRQVFNAPVSDTEIFSSGHRSLKIPNSFAEQSTLYFKEVKLKPDTLYTVSADIKGANPGIRVILRMTSSAPGDWAGFRENARTSLRWQRVSFSFRTRKRPNDFYALSVSTGNDKYAVPGDIWLDNIRICEGKTGSYAPAGGMEAFVDTEKEYYIIENGVPASAKAVLRVCNNEKAAFSSRLVVTATDDDIGKRIFSKAFAVELAPGEMKELPFEIPLKRFGAFRLDVSRAGGGKTPVSYHPGYFATAGKYHRHPVNLKNTFCVGLNIADANLRRTSSVVHNAGVHSAGRAFGDSLRILSDMGCRIARDWPFSSLQWRICEPEPGKFDFSGVDRTFELYERFGITMVPILGHADFIDLPSKKKGCRVVCEPPDWVQAECKRVKKPGDWPYDALLPPVRFWRKYIRKTVSYCKDKTKYYEIMNEPNGYLSASIYLKYLKAASEEIKAADSNAQIIGFCSTGDYGSNAVSFLAKCFEFGGLKYVDVVSFHPYDAPHLGSLLPADKQIGVMQKLIKKYGKGKNYPFWNTELFFLTGQGNDGYEKSLHKSYHAAWRFLTDLGEGAAQSICLDFDWIFKSTLTPHAIQSVPCTCFHVLSGDFPAYNALARFFEGAKPFDKIKWNRESICYVYKRNGKYLAAFWNFGKSKQYITLPFTENQAKLYDIYGNPVSFSTGKLPLTKFPCYLTWDGDGGKFSSLLKKIDPEMEQSIQTAKYVRLFPDGKTYRAVVGLENITNKTIVCRAGLNAKGITALSFVKATVKPQQSLDLQIPVKITGKEIPAKAVLKIWANGRIRNFPVKMIAPGKIHKVKAGSNPVKLLIHSGKYSEDFKASFSSRIKRDKLKIKISVRDSTNSGASAGRQLWEQDGIELFIDSMPNSMPVKFPESYHGRVGRIFMNPYAQEENRMVLWPGGLKNFTRNNINVKIRNTSSGYNAEITLMPMALGLKEFLPEKYIGMEIKVNNAFGTEKAKEFLRWNSNGPAHKNRMSLGLLKF